MRRSGPIGSIWKALTARDALSYRARTGYDEDGYFAQVCDNYRDLCNGFDYYRALVSPLTRNRSLTVLPVYEVATSAAEGRKVVCL